MGAAGSRFDRADLTGAQFESQDFKDATFDGASLAGTWFVECRLGPDTLRGAQPHRTQVLRCTGTEYVPQAAPGAWLMTTPGGAADDAREMAP
jgi:hypothetical protein